MDKSRVLKVLAVDRGSVYELTITGSLTESSELSLAGVPRGRRVVVDVGGLASINSMGIRTWTNFLSGLSRISDQVSIRRLPPRMVSQAGMVKNFLDGAIVESFYAPYCCEECGHETLELLPSYAALPELTGCPECGESMFFDDLMESYLAFRSDTEQADTVPADPPLHLMLDPGSSEDTTTRSAF
ncbi:MAG: zinc ribbon domain-containing protein [Deltaproteobacteria bacterium]|nr:zinc ribbon domain-containing protein [Deltaproteobacteria bacterium]